MPFSCPCSMHCRSTLRLVVGCGVWPGQADLSAGHVLVAVLLNRHLLLLFGIKKIFVYIIATRITISQLLMVSTGECFRYLSTVQEYDSCLLQSHGRRWSLMTDELSSSEPLSTAIKVSPKSSSLGVNITSKENALIDQDRTLPHSTRVDSPLTAANSFNATGKRFRIISTWWINQRKDRMSLIISSATLCCHN
jgi:hypothetical protein